MTKTRTAGPGHVNAKAAFKAGPDAELAEGEFIAYASVFGNRDSYGEVVQKGAFAESLAEWAKGDNPIPLLWGHNFADPDYNLGFLKEAVEDDRGLKVHAVLDMESPKAAQVYRLLKSGRVAQMSFAFDVEKETFVEPESEDNGDGTKTITPGYWSLEKLKIHEVSVVPLGANQETEVLAVKSAADALRAKAGKALSAKNESVIRETVDRLEEGLDALKSILPADEESGDEEDQDQTSGKGTVPGDAKSAGQTTPTSPSVSLAQLDALEFDIVASA
ncbi:HK97 family phage prohead protease [Gordonia sp. DT219]|uniref:HK97 family phage prohead protease n=1 Tax=Gordonia sp. DT219 TaxID=3416658 RepID=UPI003CEAA452